MDLETLRRIVDQLITSIRPIAERNPDQHTQKEDFERILESAKGHFSYNEVIWNMDSGPGKGISVIDLMQKLSIIKTAIEMEDETRLEGKSEWEEPEE